jgi:DNA-binding CsgD family transcriptional regulator
LAEWLSSLTKRRRDVAELLATGHTTKEIAELSGCTTNAVRMIRMALRHSFQAYLKSVPQPGA